MKRCNRAAAVLAVSCTLAACSVVAETVDLFPVPQNVTWTGTNMNVGSGTWQICVHSSSESLTDLGAERIKDAFTDHGLTTPTIVTSEPSSKGIFLGTPAYSPPGLAAGITAAGYQSNGSDLETQGYTLVFDVAAEKVFILGKDPHGALYGTTCLEQLLKGTGGSAYLVEARIQDWPDLKHRILAPLPAEFYYYNNEHDRTVTFSNAFRSYLNDFMIPRRINMIDGVGFGREDWQTEDPEMRKRLKLAVTMAREHGVEYEHSTHSTACSTEDHYQDKLDGVPPYDELLWDASHEKFYCYTRTNMIRPWAAEVGQFMADMEIRHIYVHNQDNGFENCWLGRCSQCLAQWPSGHDTNLASFGEAQAGLINVYYDELKKSVTNLAYHAVPSLYGATGNEAFHQAVHSTLDHADVTVLVRENTAAQIDGYRSNYPGRGVYFGIWPARGMTQYWPIFVQSARFTKNFYDGPNNDADLLFTARDVLARDLNSSCFAYYTWNVDAPGGNITTNYDGFCNARRDAEGMDAGAELALTNIVNFHYGSDAQDVLAAFRTWVGPGLMADPERIFDNFWYRVDTWWPEADGMSEEDKRIEILDLHLTEANRAYTALTGTFTEASCPDDLHRSYGGILKCHMLAEPRYLEYVARKSDAQDDYRLGLNKTIYAITNRLPLYTSWMSDYITFQGFNVEKPATDCLAELEQFFMDNATVPLTAVAVSSNRVELKWLDDRADEDGWRLKRSLTGEAGTWTNTWHLPPNTTTFVDTGVAPETLYYYKVKWTNTVDGPYCFPVSTMTCSGSEPTNWVAYNDMAWEWLQPRDKISMVTRDEKGLLVDYNTGVPVPVLLTIDAGGKGPYPFTDPETDRELEEGTDAHDQFDGIVDVNGHVSYGTNLNITIEGLDPSGWYEIVLFGDRENKSYTNRLTMVTITNAATFENSSTPGTVFSGASDPSVVITNGYNTAAGYVARFSYVDPGSDGAFGLIVSDGGSAAPPKFYANALKIRRSIVDPPTMPSNLTVVAVSTDAVELAWVDTSSTEENFQLLRGTSPTNMTDEIEVPANSVSYTNTGLAPGTTYYYRIRAEHSVLGNSPYTDPPVMTKTAQPPGPFTAYNDLAWASGQLSNNITLWTREERGLLVDYANGKAVSAFLTVNNGGSGPITSQGANAVGGTDAANLFSNRVDCTGLIGYGGTNVVLTFTGLSPDWRYELALFGNRDAPTYTDRYSTFTISNTLTFVNRSSDTVAISSDRMTNDTARMVTGDNTAAGLLARYTDITVSGGRLDLTVHDSAGTPYVNAFMLKAATREPDTMLIGRKADWRYEDTGTDLGTGWRASGYNDSGWSQGNGVLGYGGAPDGIDTTISYGSDPNNKYRTAYFRKSFTLDYHPSALEALTMFVRYDDGFVAYLNGQEVARRNMPGGAISYDTLASDQIESRVYETIDLTSATNLLVQGGNVLAVEMHQGAVNSSDLVMDMELFIDVLVQGASWSTKIARGASWKYFEGSTEASDPVTAWREPDFNDSGWPSGGTPIGYGFGGELVTDLTNMYDTYSCVFLRQTFTVDDPMLVSEMALDFERDDGFIMWVNGEEYMRVNVTGAPGSFKAYDALAELSQRASWSNNLTGGAMPAFLAGTNIMAIQLFNRALTSSDLILDLGLSLLEGSTLSIDDDGDMDGMHDGWETDHCSGGEGVANRDLDGDGIPELGEYIAGTDPQDGTNAFGLAFNLSGTDLLVSFETLAATQACYNGATRYYALEERTTGLTTNGLWLGLPGYTNIAGQGQTVVYTNTETAQPRYYRGRVWLGD